MGVPVFALDAVIRTHNNNSAMLATTNKKGVCLGRFLNRFEEREHWILTSYPPSLHLLVSGLSTNNQPLFSLSELFESIVEPAREAGNERCSDRP